VRWCAREGITPTILISQPPLLRKLVEAYQEEAKNAGRQLKLGESVGVLRAVYLADNHAQAEKLANEGVCGTAFREFFYHFGFFEAWREAADDVKYGKKMLPNEEATVARMERADFAYLGTVEDVRRRMDALVENAHPEWFVWQGDQGLLPKARPGNRSRFSARNCSRGTNRTSTPLLFTPRAPWREVKVRGQGSGRGSAAEERPSALPRSTHTSILPQRQLGEEVRSGREELSPQMRQDLFAE